MKLFNNMKLMGKLMGGMGLVIIMFIFALGIYYYTNQFMTTRFDSVWNTGKVIADNSRDIESTMLQCRRNEKDFLLRKDKKYLSKLEKNISHLKDKANAIVKCSKNAKSKIFEENAVKIIGQADQYLASFQTLVSLWEQRGLDHKSGIQGKFRSIVHELADSVADSHEKDAMILLLTLRKHEKDYLLRLDKKYVEKTLATISQLADNPSISKDKINQYKASFQKLVQIDVVIKEAVAKMREAVHKIEPLVKENAMVATKSAESKMAAAKERGSYLGSLALVIAIIAVAAGLFIAIFITLNITGAIKKIAGLAKGMADGDLTQTLDIDQKDEIGLLADSMNHMAANLKKMFSDITDGIQTLTSSSTELSAVSNQITSNSDTTTEKSNSVSAAAEEMSTNMNSVAAATEQATANIQMIVAASEEMTATIQEIAGNMARGSETTSQAVEKAKEVSGKVDDLGKSAADISKVTDTIKDISEQTNLLALNATIEAARAGEAGKGFAVVAGEIKALAQQTAEATSQINNRISGVQDITAESVTAIESIVGVINEINEIVTTVAAAIEEQSATTQEISNNVSQAGLGVQEVNENVNQISAVTGEVTQDISEVSQAAQETNKGSIQVNENATELSKLAENLNEMVGRFKI